LTRAASEPDHPGAKESAVIARALTGMGRRVVPRALRELEEELRERVTRASVSRNEYGFDPYGFEPEAARKLMLPAAILYRWYFRVQTHDIALVPSGRVLLIANHAGQFGYDGAMLCTAMLLDADPPRIARGMGEFFLWKLPWVGTAGARMGMMVGTPANCAHMLEHEQCVMVFPEGARGANKPFRKRYQLQRFGHGFMRLALETRAPIVPVGIVGSEEQQPGLANLESLGRSLSLPSFPITISSPWLGLFGPAFALPVKYHIYFGAPMDFGGDANEEDALVQQKVEAVKQAIDVLLARGRRERRGIFR
jgi:1-acyl-sn-glycerol-3-phosphate acyltransferase